MQSRAGGRARALQVEGGEPEEGVGDRRAKKEYRASEGDFKKKKRKRERERERERERRENGGRGATWKRRKEREAGPCHLAVAGRKRKTSGVANEIQENRLS